MGGSTFLALCTEDRSLLTFMSFLTSGSSKRRPISRLASKTVLVGFMAETFLAESPMSLSSSVNET